MDFTLEETQQAIARLAAEVLDQGRPAAASSPVPAARDADGYGMNGIAEAVRQVRGTSVNRVADDGPVLVTAGTGVPASGLVLGPA